MEKPGVCDSPGGYLPSQAGVVPGFLEEEAPALEQGRGGTAGRGEGAGQCCRERNIGQGLDKLLLINRRRGLEGGAERRVSAES